MSQNSTLQDLLVKIAEGRTDAVFDLLAAGHPATTRDAGGVPIIRWCAYYGDVSAMRLLLERGEAKASLGPNLDLNAAAFHGHWRLVQFLLEEGAEAGLGLPDTGETPLHAALCSPTRQGQDHVVSLLLAHGADPRAATYPGFETGSFMRDVRTVAETPLHRAAAYGSTVSIRLLIDAGAAVEVRDAQGETPLSWASRHLRSAEVLRMLTFGPHQIHPDSPSTGDRGVGPTAMDVHLLGTPR